jgi:GH35 family endo-1,4-beta-xylanase
MGVGEYVRRSFKAARAGNPEATLIINDYHIEDFDQKVISQLVDDSGRQLYDVIGIQSHMHIGYWGVEKTWNACEKFAKFGKPIHFTELTILSGKLKEDDDWFSRREGWLSTEQGEKRQAQQVAELYTLLFSHPSVEAVTVWDFTDYNAWQGAPSGYIRKDMTPKPAYLKLKQLIKSKWWTKTETSIAGNGQARFRGFLGQYKVTAQTPAGKLSGSFALDKTTKETIGVDLS